MNNVELIPITHAAAQLGMTADTLRRRVQTGSVAGQVVAGRYFLPAEELKRLLAECRPGEMAFEPATASHDRESITVTEYVRRFIDDFATTQRSEQAADDVSDAHSIAPRPPSLSDTDLLTLSNQHIDDMVTLVRNHRRAGMTLDEACLRSFATCFGNRSRSGNRAGDSRNSKP